MAEISSHWGTKIYGYDVHERCIICRIFIGVDESLEALSGIFVNHSKI